MSKFFDPELYSEDKRRELFPHLYPSPNPSVQAHPAPTKLALQPVAVQPSVVAPIVRAVAAAGVPVRTGATAVRDYFTPIRDADVPGGFRATMRKYRALAREWGVPDTVVLCYRVRAGFTLKRAAPKLGPCYQNFQYLQDWNFSDEPTQDCLVCWIPPRLVPRSTAKTKDEQLQHLADIRIHCGLPSHHLSSFGSVALLAGLILAHYKATGERTPLDCYWVRTDTCDAGGHRLKLAWAAGALYCARWAWDGERHDRIGGVALGVER